MYLPLNYLLLLNMKLKTDNLIDRLIFFLACSWRLSQNCKLSSPWYSSLLMLVDPRGMKGNSKLLCWYAKSILFQWLQTYLPPHSYSSHKSICKNFYCAIVVMSTWSTILQEVQYGLQKQWICSQATQQVCPRQSRYNKSSEDFFLK